MSRTLTARPIHPASRLQLFAMLAAVLWAAVPLDPCGAAAAQPAADPARLMTEIVPALGLQTEIPKPEPVEPEPTSTTHWHIPNGVATALLLGAVGIGLALVLAALRKSIGWPTRRFKPRRSKARRPIADATILPLDEILDPLVASGADAEALARAGRYGEAMHLLLLRSLVELRARLGLAMADSLTSREILGRLTLPAAGRRALADLIDRVEWTEFGGRAASAETYQTSRSSFEAFVAALRSAAAA
jgi:hypothetical protein